jgi:hypothetical protein
LASQPSIDSFIAYYDNAHRNPINRAIHHLAHAIGVIGAVLLLFRPLLGVLLIAASFPLSWSGHYLYEHNTPAFFDPPANGAPRLAKKIEVALGGVMWSVVCLWRAVAWRERGEGD